MKTATRKSSKSNGSSAVATVATPEDVSPAAPAVSSNGNGAQAHAAPLDVGVLLTVLRRMGDGDFSVRLPNTWVGLEGKVADTFNEIVAPRAGTVSAIFVEDGQPVEFGEPLLAIE